MISCIVISYALRLATISQDDQLHGNKGQLDDLKRLLKGVKDLVLQKKSPNQVWNMRAEGIKTSSWEQGQIVMIGIGTQKRPKNFFKQ